jgi:hypothetical protein
MIMDDVQSQASGAAEDASDEDGLTIALSPMQLAAVLHGATLRPEASFWDGLGVRAWGALGVAQGVGEAGIAAGLLALPEPSTLSKLAGVATALHAADVASTGIDQLWTGREGSTLTRRTATVLARQQGSSRYPMGQIRPKESHSM